MLVFRTQIWTCSFAVRAYHFSASPRHFSSINMQSTLQKTLPTWQLRRRRYRTQRGQSRLCPSAAQPRLHPPSPAGCKSKAKAQRHFPSLKNSLGSQGINVRKDQGARAWVIRRFLLLGLCAPRPPPVIPVGTSPDNQCNSVTSALFPPFAKKKETLRFPSAEFSAESGEKQQNLL